jgi:hypothetical protein
MNLRFGWIGLAAVGMLAGFWIGETHAQRLASRSGIPASRSPIDIPADANVEKIDEACRLFLAQKRETYGEAEFWEFYRLLPRRAPRLAGMLRRGERGQPLEDPVRAKSNLKSLALKVRDAARIDFVHRYRGAVVGRGIVPDMALWAHRSYLEADLALCVTKEERMKTLDEHWALLKRLENFSGRRYENGVTATYNHFQFVYERLCVEHELVEAMPK